MFVDNDKFNLFYRGYLPSFAIRVNQRRAERMRAHRMEIERVEREAVAAQLSASAERRREARRKAIAKAYADEVEATKEAMRRLPEWVRDIVVATCKRHRQPVLAMFQDMRNQGIVVCRDEILYTIRAAREPSFPIIGGWFRKDHTTIMAAVARHAERTGLPVLCYYNLGRTRVKNRAAADRYRAGQRSALDRRAGQ